uniref:Uncharacterized protein n=1 Tax=Cannabis sativa TaxID=3483 RepID=A0A803R9U4_CANSA
MASNSIWTSSPCEMAHQWHVSRSNFYRAGGLFVLQIEGQSLDLETLPLLLLQQRAHLSLERRF